MNMKNTKSSWFRRNFWPIYGKENRKFIPMMIMMACALFTYTCLRITKDVLVLTAPGATALVLSNLKFYFVLPISVLFITLFMFLNKRLSKEKLFFVTLLPFVIFFFVFAFLLRPNIQYLHASPEWIFAAQEAYPRLTSFIPVFGNWIYSLFYIMAELWGSVVITFLFWGFASYAVSKEERVRFFSFFACYGNLGLILASIFEYKLSNYCILNNISSKSAEYLKLTANSFYIVIFTALLFAFCYWYLNAYVLPYDNIEIAKGMKAKPKSTLSFFESLKLIFTNKILFFICICVLAYGVSINLVEVTWKGLAKEIYPGEIHLKLFFAKLYLYVGISTIVLAFLMKDCVSKIGWRKTSLVTPTMLLSTSSLFFIFLIYGKYLPSSLLLGYTSLQIALFLGTIQNVLSKATKYVLFDPTIQMAYIPLKEDVRLNGKAAVDVIGGRAGKSLGSVIQNILDMLLKGAKGLILAPYLFPITLVLGVGWLLSTISLGNLYEAAMKEKDSSKE